MTPHEANVVNVGSALRQGLQLKTVEVVAVLLNACNQIDAGMAVALPTTIDDLRVTQDGTVVLPATARTEPTRAAVARLLESLLPESSDITVPPALRTLPARLRESGGGTQPSEMKDLLTVLRWHLPDDSSAVLRDLVARMQLATLESQAEPAIDLFADEGDDPLPAAVPPAAVALTPAIASRPRNNAPLIGVSILLAISAAGYAGYQFTNARLTPDAVTAVALPAAPVSGRIVRADASPQSPVSGLRDGVTTRALRLDVPGGAFSPSFASGGTSLLFHAGHNQSGRLFQVSLDDRGQTSKLAPLLEARGRTYHVRPSPDGLWVAFDSDRDGVRGVYIASRNGQHVERVSGDGFAAVPSWSPDMKWLAFVRAEADRPNVWNMWLRDVESGELTRHTAYRSGQVWGASWFPGSRAFAFSHEDQLITRDLDSRQTTTFRSPIAGRLLRTPAVSPDGATVVFQVHRDGAWLMNVKSGVMTRVLDDPTAEEFAWSPDGRQIAYHSRRDGEWKIWLLTL